MKKIKSWHLTVGGIVSQLPILWNQVMTIFDGDPSTNLNWFIVSSSIAVIAALFKAKGTSAPVDTL